jgi:uncharacterized membrane protein YhdT
MRWIAHRADVLRLASPRRWLPSFTIENFGAAIGVTRMIAGLAVWLFAAIVTYTGKTNTEGTEGMSDWFVAFIISPAAVIALGYAAVLWHEHSMRQNNVKPGE